MSPEAIDVLVYIMFCIVFFMSGVISGLILYSRDKKVVKVKKWLKRNIQDRLIIKSKGGK